MTKEELVKKIKTVLEEGPFADEEIAACNSKMGKMNEADLNELLNLLNEEANILKETDQLLANLADELAKERKEKTGQIPAGVSVRDMKIGDIAAILAGNLSPFLKMETDFIKQLELYFSESDEEERKTIVEDFDSFVRSVVANKEPILGPNRPAIGKWLNLYDQFNDSRERKGLDRINFVNQNNLTRQLNPEERKIILKLLKLYDYLLNPLVVEETEEIAPAFKPPKPVTAATAAARTLTEEEKKKVADLRAMLAKYAPGSLERKVVEEELKKMEKGK